MSKDTAKRMSPKGTYGAKDEWDIYFWHSKSSKGYFMDEDGNVLYAEYQPLDFSDYEAMKANYMDGLAFWLRTQLEGASSGGKE